MVSGVMVDMGDVLVVEEADHDDILRSLELGLEAIALAGRVGPQDIVGWLRATLSSRPRSRHRVREHDWHAMMSACLSELAGYPLSAEVVWHYIDVTEEFASNFQHAVPEGLALLHGLRSRKLPVAIVSNIATPHRYVRHLLGRLGIDAMVDCIVLSSDGYRRKPDPELFLAAADRLGIGIDCAVMIGDRKFEDIAGAQRAGAQAFLATWVHHDDEEIEVVPEHVVDSAAAALRLIDEDDS